MIPRRRVTHAILETRCGATQRMRLPFPPPRHFLCPLRREWDLTPSDLPPTDQPVESLYRQFELQGYRPVEFSHDVEAHYLEVL
jgi:hypothetical protein